MILRVLCLIILATSGFCAARTALLSRRLIPPIVINTWNFTNANARAWMELQARRSALDAVEMGCGQCEIDRCDGTVGWGGSPSETGETTLDAMIMDGENYNVGAVGALRRVKNAIGVARMVLERTNHTLLVGEMATEFALDMGFREENLSSNDSIDQIDNWLANSCQPNYWKNVSPDPRRNCGPYKPIPLSKEPDSRYHLPEFSDLDFLEEDLYYSSSDRDSAVELPHGHDTIGMVAMDHNLKLAAGTSTNGLRYKILGRVGDSPVPGAGSYAAKEAGAAAATGDGDVMMRFLLSYQAVENLRQGMSAKDAAYDVIDRQVRRTGRPYPEAAVVVLSKDGYFGAACSGFSRFPFVVSDSRLQLQVSAVDCVV